MSNNVVNLEQYRNRRNQKKILQKSLEADKQQEVVVSNRQELLETFQKMDASLQELDKLDPIKYTLEYKSNGEITMDGQDFLCLMQSPYSKHKSLSSRELNALADQLIYLNKVLTHITLLAKM